MTTSSLRLATLLVAVILSASACSLKLPQRAVNDVPRNYYRLNLETPQALANPRNGVLLVRPVQVNAPFAGSAFVRRGAEGTYTADPYNQFLADPGAILTDSTGQWMRSVGLFGSVVTDYSTLKPNYVLESVVEDLYGADTPEGPRAVLAARFLLVERISSTEQRVVVDLVSRQEIPIDSLASSDLVAGWEKGLGAALTDFSGEVR